MDITEFVKKYDTENQFEVMVNYFQQVKNAWSQTIDLPKNFSENISNIIITGLGGSAIAGDLIKEFLRDELNVSVETNRNYNLPKYVTQQTLCIFSSYSGNTEETVEALQQGINKSCKIICISTGGKIKEIAGDNNLPFIQLKKGYQPRYALGSSLFTLLKIFCSLNLIYEQDDIVNKIINLWEVKGKEFSEENNLASNYAKDLIGYIPVIYSADSYTSALGFRFKSEINENSKLLAFHNVIPEMNHNEIIGWEAYEKEQFNTAVITFEDKIYHDQIKKRFNIISELLQNTGVKVIRLKSTEKSFKLRMMDLVYLTDWVSYYLGVYRGKDPSEIDNIKYLKNALTS